MDGALGAGRLVAHQVPQESPVGKVEEKEQSQDMTRIQVVMQVVTYAGTPAPSTCTCV